jgi:hypothetical protein
MDSVDPQVVVVAEVLEVEQVVVVVEPVVVDFE